jgi:hypothetical protein
MVLYTATIGKVNGALRRMEIVLTAKDGVLPCISSLVYEVRIIQLKLDPNKLDPRGAVIWKYTILDLFENGSVPSRSQIGNGSPFCFVPRKIVKFAKFTQYQKSFHSQSARLDLAVSIKSSLSARVRMLTR